MAKKKVEVIIPKRSIDYISIVDEMSDEAFKFCVSHLFQLFGYQVLTEQDVRRVDLKEKFMGFESQIPSEAKVRCPGILNYYFFVLKLYFENVLKCKSGSRAEQYRKRAYSAMDKALSDNGCIEDIDDVFLCFMTILRTYRSCLNEIKNRISVKPTLSIEEADAELLKFLWETKDIIPDGIVDKKGLLDKIFGTDYEVKTAIRLMYMNNIIFLSRALQHFGGFEAEEE